METFEKAKCSQSKRIREKACNICGSQGYTNAFMYCSQCSHTIVHQYCVGIPPRNLDDVYSWVCEYCSEVTEPESRTYHALVCDSIESSEHCTVHSKAVTFKSKSEMMVIPDELKVTCKIKSEPKEMRGFSLIAEDYEEDNEIPVSCFMDYPESIMYRLVFLVSPSGIISISRSKLLCEDFIPRNAADSDTDPFLKDDEQSDTQVSSLCLVKYGEKPEAQVSSVMEYPEELSGELILLVKPGGEIVFYCLQCVVSSVDDSHFSCWKAAICSMVVRRPGPYLLTLDGVPDRSEDFAKDCSKQTCVLSKEANMWSSDDCSVFPKNYTQGMVDDILQSTECCYADGSSCKDGMIRKKRKISPCIIFDYVRPEYKRARRKRHNITLTKEASGYKKRTKRRKMKSLKSLLARDCIPPLTPDCKRGRSKRCKIRSNQLKQRFEGLIHKA